MKILYLTHPESDYGEYFLFNGLCDLLGEKNIVTYPFKRSYYGEMDNTYILDDGKQGMTLPGGHVVARERNEWSYKEIANRITEFGFMILSSPRTYAIKALHQLLDTFKSKPLPLVYSDHEDGDNIRVDLIKEFQPDVIFKRELTQLTRDIHPLPFSCAINSFPEVDDNNKIYDVFALFGMTYPIRRKVVETLLSYNLPNTYLGVDTKKFDNMGLIESNKKLIGYRDYLTMIAQSKIAISVRGHGRDTVRRWEIPAYNTCMFYCDPCLMTPYEFEDGKHVVYFKEDLSDLREKLDYYLSHDKEREEIARNGREHLLKYHTNIKRAEYFLNIVKKELCL